MNAYQWVIDTTGFELLFGLKNKTTNQWLFRYETPLSSQRSHSSLLVPLFQEACTVAKVALTEVTQLTVCVGPGSFTGLRAGLATVKTLGQWIPSLVITPITVFERLRLQAKLAGCLEEKTSLTVVLDAKQGRLYTATWLPQAGWEKPQFILMDDWVNIQKKEQFILNDTLSTHVDKLGFSYATVEALSPLALEAISLAENAPITWQQLAPLYLQSPNITIKKTMIKDVC
ncbi:MAG: tRNA (adenosine(37)-N6)-threonylcarbamoyltransferase complex dimerization subunit type 1 TsaB [Vampirovibrio sp.]|nr:tRNA (adenosine(37)-N6)-threonylcarbamoyltransferase complex dimerization subunit type 1 TsaB [Vampirovibrio sp.]